MLFRRSILIAVGLTAVLVVPIPTLAGERNPNEAATKSSALQDRSEANQSSRRRRSATDARKWEARRKKIERALKDDRLDEADAEYLRYEARAEQLPNGAERAAWWMLGAQVHYQRERFPKAILSAMKVVILAPRTGRAGNALCLAARAYEKLGRPEQSLKLYRECIDRDDVNDAMRTMCRERIAALRKGESGS